MSTALARRNATSSRTARRPTTRGSVALALSPPLSALPGSGRPSMLRPDLLRVLADLERLRIGGDELEDRRLESGALAVGVARNRAAQAVELRGKDRITQRLPADVEIAAAVSLGDRRDCP